MSLLTYHILDEATHQWKRVLHHNLRRQDLPYYAELRVINFSTKPWTSASDVLYYLKTHPHHRKIILHSLSAARLTRWRVAYLIHPLLKTPLYLGQNDGDIDFCRKIDQYIENEKIVLQAMASHLDTPFPYY